MPDEKEIENYINEAERLKILEKRNIEQANRAELEEEREIDAEKARDTSYDFYSALKPNRPGGIWAVFMAIGIYGTELVFFINVFTNEKYLIWYLVTLIFLMLWGLRQVYSWIYTYVTFNEFKKWQERLPFKVTGWEKLTQWSDEFSAYSWRVKCQIKVNWKGNYLSHQKAIEAIGYVFTKHTEENFYGLNGASVSGYAEDPRIYWKYENGVLIGSANIGVVWQIYLFIKNDLALLARKYDIVDSVEITADEEDTKIEPHISRLAH